jgi:hypothetical protein
VAKFEARLLATAGFESRHLSKIQNGRHKSSLFKVGSLNIGEKWLISRLSVPSPVLYDPDLIPLAMPHDDPAAHCTSVRSCRLRNMSSLHLQPAAEEQACSPQSRISHHWLFCLKKTYDLFCNNDSKLRRGHF